jgi:hypothetical protein
MVVKASPTETAMHVYEVRPRKDKRGVDLISERSAIRSAVVLKY